MVVNRKPVPANNVWHLFHCHKHLIMFYNRMQAGHALAA